MMNKQQIQTLVGTVLAVVGSVGVATNQFSPAEWASLSAQAAATTNSVIEAAYAVAGLVGGVMTWWASRKSSQVQAASKVSGVEVHVDTSGSTTAPASVVAMAMSQAPENASIVPMGSLSGVTSPVQK